VAWGTGSTSEERVVFEAGDKVPEGIWWRVEIVNGRHDCSDGIRKKKGRTGSATAQIL
jgi:hypothetical protein